MTENERGKLASVALCRCVYHFDEADSFVIDSRSWNTTAMGIVGKHQLVHFGFSVN